MGLFDTFVTLKGVPCPKCGKLFNAFQTKALSCKLSVYAEGDPLDKDDARIVSFKTYRIRGCIEICGSCRQAAFVDAYIHNGVFIGVSKPYNRSPIDTIAPVTKRALEAALREFNRSKLRRMPV